MNVSIVSIPDGEFVVEGRAVHLANETEVRQLRAPTLELTAIAPPSEPVEVEPASSEPAAELAQPRQRISRTRVMSVAADGSSRPFTPPQPKPEPPSSVEGEAGVYQSKPRRRDWP
jgi:hypothetical protein